MKAFISLALAVTVLCAALPFVADLSDAASPELSVITVSRDTFVFEASESGTWLFDDGFSEVGASVTHTFSLSGLHRVSFRGASGTGEIVALVVDEGPVAVGAAGSSFRYCPGIVRNVTTDCPGLSYNDSLKCLVGAPATAGDYTVTITHIDGVETSFDLHISDYPPGWFDLSVDHQTLKVDLVWGDQVKKCSWTVRPVSGPALTGLGTSCTFEGLPLGTYTVTNLVSMNFGSFDSQSRTFTISELDDDQEEDEGGDDLRALYWVAVIGLAIFFSALILRVI